MRCSARRVAGWSGSADPARRRRAAIIAALGIGQIIVWGSSYYLIAVLARPIAASTGWPLPWVVGGSSVGFLVSGLLSPRIGRRIEAEGGRRVLGASAVLLAAGLLALAAAPSLPLYLAAWALVGAGMGAGLYDPAFAALGRMYGEQARSAITAVTLFGGFASTVCWPLSAWLVERAGWRGACVAYAAINLLVVLPLYALALPPSDAPAASPRHGARGTQDPPARRGAAFVLVAASTTLSAVVSTLISVHLLTVLQARGATLGAAVAVGALLGPSQVGARVLETAFGRRAHPVWGLLGSSVLMAVGLAVLFAAPGAAGAAIVLYGSGAGLRSIVRGTVPLALFGPQGYAALMGRIAMPSLIGQAAAPVLGGLLMARAGADATVLLLVAAAVLNIVPALLLLPLARRPA